MDTPTLWNRDHILHTLTQHAKSNSALALMLDTLDEVEKSISKGDNPKDAIRDYFTEPLASKIIELNAGQW